MKIHIITLFPEAFESFLAHSMVRRAREKKIVDIRTVTPRDFTRDRHRTCDDKPFGGGPGMLMKPEPLFEALESILGRKKPSKKNPVIYLTPAGRKFDQKTARSLAGCREMVLICGHYEGVDERVIQKWVTDELSIGDYVLTQGELPAMVVADAVLRLLPGALGCADSKTFESFSVNLLEYPQYTRPAEYRGLKVPEVLLSGNHQKIAEWRQKEATKRTLKRRPDLLRRKGINFNT